MITITKRHKHDAWMMANGGSLGRHARRQPAFNAGHLPGRPGISARILLCKLGHRGLPRRPSATARKLHDVSAYGDRPQAPAENGGSVRGSNFSNGNRKPVGAGPIGNSSKISRSFPGTAWSREARHMTIRPENIGNQAYYNVHGGEGRQASYP